VIEVLSPEGGECRTKKPITVVKSGYISQAISSSTIGSDSDAIAEDAEQCSTLVLDTLPWKRIRISLVGLYGCSQPFR